MWIKACNSIGLEGARRITEGLKCNRTLTALELYGDEEKKNKVDIFEERKIWTGNNIGDEGVRLISEELKGNSTLTELNLGGDEREFLFERC